MNSTYKVLEEFDKRVSEITVYSEIRKWFGIAFEVLMTIGIICAINLSPPKPSGILIIMGYIIYMLSMYIDPILTVGNEKGVNIYRLLKYIPLKRMDIFKARVIKILKLMSKRIAAFILLQIIVMFLENNFEIELLLEAVFPPVFLTASAIFWCTPFKI